MAPSDTSVIYVGTGDIITGGSINEGNGVYESTDAGRTWQHMGLDATKQIPSILVDPANPDVVMDAAQGNVHATSDQRGEARLCARQAERDLGDPRRALRQAGFGGALHALGDMRRTTTEAPWIPESTFVHQPYVPADAMQRRFDQWAVGWLGHAHRVEIPGFGRVPACAIEVTSHPPPHDADH